MNAMTVIEHARRDRQDLEKRGATFITAEQLQEKGVNISLLLVQLLFNNCEAVRKTLQEVGFEISTEHRFGWQHEGFKLIELAFFLE
jgi:hypothetical protein